MHNFHHLVATVVVAFTAISSAAFAQVRLTASVAPTFRALEIGEATTFFATLQNFGSANATNCRVEGDPDRAFGNDLDYQQTDAANQPIGSANAPFDLAAGASQSLVLTLRPVSEGYNSGYVLNYVCDEGVHFGAIGLASPYLSVYPDAESHGDVITILQTISGDGILTINESGRRGVAAGAAVNIGDTQTFMFLPSLNFGMGVVKTIDRGQLICETDAVAQCLQPPSTNFVREVATNEIVTFNIYFDDEGSTNIPFLPDIFRYGLFVLQQTGLSALVGGSSVAVTDNNNSPDPDPFPQSGQWTGFIQRDGERGLDRYRITLNRNGNFVLTSNLSFLEDGNDDDPGIVLFGRLDDEIGRQVRPDGMVGRIIGRNLLDDASLAGLNLVFRETASGRPAALGARRVRGFYLQNTPSSGSLYFRSGEAAGYMVQGLHANPFSISGNVAHSGSSTDRLNGSLSFTQGEATDTCNIVIQLGPDGPSYNPFVELRDCTNNTGLSLNGDYTGFGTAETWTQSASPPQFVCSLLVFVTRYQGADDLLLPLWIHLPRSGTPGCFYD